MPFDMMQNNGGGGGDPGDLLAKALAVVIGSVYGAGARPAHFGPGQNEIVNIDIAIHVSDDGKQFKVEGARLNRWEQIEIDKGPDLDPDAEHLIG